MVVFAGILMVLGGSFEFWKQYNKEIVERESDDVELPPLIKQFKNLSENKKERPLCLPYSLKARFFIHAHLSRFQLSSLNLQNGTIFLKNSFRMFVCNAVAVERGNGHQSTRLGS